MNKTVFLTILFFNFFFTSVEAQNLQTSSPVEGASNQSNDEVYIDPLTKETSFPGGKDSMNAFILKNMVFPQELKEKKIQGKVYISTIVDKNGSLTQIKVLKGIPDCPTCDQAALDVVKKMPKWSPAENNGVPVFRRVFIPFYFK